MPVKEADNGLLTLTSARRPRRLPQRRLVPTTCEVPESYNGVTGSTFSWNDIMDCQFCTN